MILGDPKWDYRIHRFRSPRRTGRSIRASRASTHRTLTSPNTAARRQADSLGRLEQRPRARRRRAGLLQERRNHDRHRGHAARRSPLHGAGHDRMQRRTGHRHLRHARRHAALGRERPGAERGDSRRASSTGRSCARGRYAPIRQSRRTEAAGARTTRTASSASRESEHARLQHRPLRRPSARRRASNPVGHQLLKPRTDSRPRSDRRPMALAD